jgi:hypothetical protein
VGNIYIYISIRPFQRRMNMKFLKFPETQSREYVLGIGFQNGCVSPDIPVLGSFVHYVG